MLGGFVLGVVWFGWVLFVCFGVCCLGLVFLVGEVVWVGLLVGLGGWVLVCDLVVFVFLWMNV